MDATVGFVCPSTLLRRVSRLVYPHVANSQHLPPAWLFALACVFFIFRDLSFRHDTIPHAAFVKHSGEKDTLVTLDKAKVIADAIPDSKVRINILSREASTK